MPLPPRIIGYDGGDPVQILEHFEADARGAQGHDWYPISQTWTDGVLFVEYEHDPDRSLRTAAKLAAHARQRPAVMGSVRALASGSHNWVPSVIVVALIVAAVVGVSMIAFSPGDQRSGTTGDVRPAPSATIAGSRPSSGPVSTLEPTEAPEDPSPTPRPSPSERPPSDPSEDPSIATFKDGIWEVGADIAPGTYKTLGGEGCYWSRLRRLTGRQRDIISERRVSGPAIVTIKRRDVGFESARCRSWTSDLSRVTESRTEFGEGTYQVGVDITAGMFRSRSITPCSWERLRGFTGDKDDTIDRGVQASGRRTVIIRGSDAGFSSVGCGTWTRVRR
jgi:hypothetical protein